VTPGGHLVTTAAAAAAVYAGTGSLELTAGLAAGGFLIDVDHAVDYVLFDGQRDLRPATFLRHYNEGRFDRLVLLLHSYELAALFGVIAWLTNQVWLWGYVLGMALHLPLDVVFNGRYEPGGMLAFYSLTYRWRVRFRAERLLTRAYLGPTPPGFLAAFFVGPSVRRPEPAQKSPGLAPRVILDSTEV
jgi:hypothetical protein